jgi:hypothetical protein
LVSVGSVVGVLIGVLAIVVPIVVTATDRTTAGDTIVVDSQFSSDEGEGLAAEPDDVEDAKPAELIEPVAAGLSASAGDASSSGFMIRSEWFAVPIDAPWAELYATPGACTTEIVDWFKTYAKPVIPQEITSYITNSATTGAVATVSDIRAQGTLTAPPVPTVKVGATGCTGGGEDGIYATMALGVDPVAVYDDCYSPSEPYPCTGSAEVAPTAGDPVRFDVAPGETRTLHLSWTQTMDFVGRFVAALTVDGTVSTIDITPDAVDLTVPALTRPDDVLYFDVDGPWCEDGPETRHAVCDFDTWLAIVAGE